MEPADVAQVMLIERSSNPSPWSEASMKSELDNDQATYFVAERAGCVVGFCGYWCVIDEAHITNVAVHDQERRLGIGTMLVRHALDRAYEAGMRCATLEVRASNGAAISLYLSLGFVKAATRKNYYHQCSEDAVVMWKYDLESDE